MEDGHPAAPSHSPVLDHHPPHEPTTVVGDEEQPHEKKSFMTRIHNKVNKLKHNYNKKKHAHDQVSEVPVEGESEEFDDSNEDMDVDSEASSNPSVYESLATSREFDGEHGPLVTPETVKPPPVTFETDKPRGRDEPPVTFPTDKPPVFGGREVPTDKPPVFGGRDEPPVTFPTDKPPVFGGRDEPPVTFPTDKPPVFGGRDEPPITLETDKPPVLGGREEPPVTLETEKPYVLGGRDEPPVTFPTDKSQVRDEPETDKSSVLGGRPSVTFETDKPHFFGGRDTLETDKPYLIGGRDEPPVTPETMKATTVEEEPVAPLPYGSLPPETMKATTVEEEPVAPLPYGSLPRTTDDDDTNLPTSVGPTPGNESSVPPEVLNSLQAMSISWSETQKDPEDEILVNHMSSDIEKKPSYTEKLGTTAAADEAAAPARTVSGPTGTPPTSYSEKLSSTAFAAKDAAVSAASMVYGKVAGKEEGTHSSEIGGEVVTLAGTEEGAGEKKGSYTDRAYAAKDAAVMTASTMYGKMVGAGAAMMGNVVDTEQDKGSVREFSAEKGGEEDEVVKGRIELPEVTSREVVSDAPAEVLTDAPPAVDAKSGGYTGQGMVEMITGAFTSFVGGGGGVADAPATSGGGGRGGVADTPAVVVEDPSGGAGKERESEVLGE